MGSYLRGFDTKSINDLLYCDVTMKYTNLRPPKGTKEREFPYLCGLYQPETSLISINRKIKKFYPRTWKKEEDITILHEWLHAYEHVIVGRNFSENQIEWWAQWYYREQYDLVPYIRSFFNEEGF